MTNAPKVDPKIAYKAFSDEARTLRELRQLELQYGPPDEEDLELTRYTERIENMSSAELDNHIAELDKEIDGYDADRKAWMRGAPDKVIEDHYGVQDRNRRR